MLKEFYIIDKYFKPLAKKHKDAYLLKEDAALFSIRNNYKAVITTDTLIEGIHFFKGDIAKSIANKVMHVNLSDIAAMGAIPKFYTIALTLSNEQIKDDLFFQEFSNELSEIQKKYNITLLGGDTCLGETLSISITMIGEILSTLTPLLKSQAKDKDSIFISNTIGDSHLGLMYLKNKNQEIFQNLDSKDIDYLKKSYYFKEAQISLGDFLLNHSRCATDISDGLTLSLQQVLTLSKLEADIDLNKIPLSKVASKIISKNKNLIIDLITGGDDYQLLFTIPHNRISIFNNMINYLNLKVTEIGTLKKTIENTSNANYYLDGKKITITKNSFSHF